MMDVLLIVLVCVLANHMGLIQAIEKHIRHKLYIIDCIKCSTFWFTLIYMLFDGYRLILALALAFTFSYLAIWLEIILGFIDVCYEKFYEKTYKESGKDNSVETED